MTNAALLETARELKRYDRGAPSYDRREKLMEPVFRSWRNRIWGLVPPESRVLEAGVGTGKNFRFYPRDVHRACKNCGGH